MVSVVELLVVIQYGAFVLVVRSGIGQCVLRKLGVEEWLVLAVMSMFTGAPVYAYGFNLGSVYCVTQSKSRLVSPAWFYLSGAGSPR